MASWCDHPASKAICQYGVPAARVYCAYCSGPVSPEDIEPTLYVKNDIHGGVIDEDPDNRPYFWDLPEGDCKCH